MQNKIDFFTIYLFIPYDYLQFVQRRQCQLLAAMLRPRRVDLFLALQLHHSPRLCRFLRVRTLLRKEFWWRVILIISLLFLRSINKTRMTTSISIKALCNYIKDIWKIISKIKREKNHETFHYIFFLHFCFL